MAEPKIGDQGGTVLDEPERPKHGEEIKLNGLHRYVCAGTYVQECQHVEVTPSVRMP